MGKSEKPTQWVPAPLRALGPEGKQFLLTQSLARDRNAHQYHADDRVSLWRELLDEQSTEQEEKKSVGLRKTFSGTLGKRGQ